MARGNVLTITGDEEVMDQFEIKFNLIIQHYHKYNSVTENNIDNLMLDEGEKMISSDDGSETLVHGNQGVKIKARTLNQKKLVESVNKNDMVFAVGPAVAARLIFGAGTRLLKIPPTAIFLLMVLVGFCFFEDETTVCFLSEVCRLGVFPLLTPILLLLLLILLLLLPRLLQL